MIEYGGDYNPEQWPETVWPDDVRLMRQAGVTLATVGVFAWSRIQPAEGAFDFDWLDRIIDQLHAGGIGVDLATATASPPHWFSHAYPDSLPVTRDGVRLGPGSRQHYAATSPDYIRLAGELVTRLADRYATHPAIRYWHVNNEYGCHVPADYSDHAATAFRTWLRTRYLDIEAVNEAWGTAFWSQRYGSFEQVLPPRAAPYSVNPGLWLDFKRFTSDSYLHLFRMEKRLIRAAGAAQPVTTNFMGAFEAIDYWSWRDEVDIIADDSYPDPADPDSFRDAAFTRDLMRSLGRGRPWLLMEQAANTVNWRPVNAAKQPGKMAALSRQAVARGAMGVLFFQWRQSRRGAEKYHSAMLPHAGTATRTWHEITALGATLATLPAPTPAAPADVAVLYDWPNRWSLEAPDHPAQLDYPGHVLDWYRALHRRNVPTDIAPPDEDLQPYRLIIAPHLALLTDTAAASLVDWVHAGGTLVTTAFTDVVDEHDAFLPGGFLTRLAPVIGARVLEHEGLPEPAPITIGPTAVRGTRIADVLDVHDAEIIGTFAAGWRTGHPVILRRRSGNGTTIHVGVAADQAGVETLVDLALHDAGIPTPLAGIPDPVEVIPGQRGTVLINHGPNPVPTRLHDAPIRLAPWDVQHIPHPARETGPGAQPMPHPQP
jgi:beta-galactosidase